MSDWAGIPVKPLARRAKRLREPFSTAPTGTIIPAALGVGIRTVSKESEAGIASPLTEQEYTGSDFYTLTSSDGLFVFEFSATTQYLDAVSRSVVVVHRDPDA